MEFEPYLKHENGVQIHFLCNSKTATPKSNYLLKLLLKILIKAGDKHQNYAAVLVDQWVRLLQPYGLDSTRVLTHTIFQRRILDWAAISFSSHN